jgi:hypothetical protein
MKIVLVAGAVLAVLGTGGLTGAALTAAPERPPVADDSSQEPTDDPSDDVEDTDDEGDSDEGSGKPDDEAKAAQHAAQRAFVAAKQEWTACVGEAAPAHEPGAGPFDPEEACGPKPHPHDDDADDSEKPGASGGEREHGKPAWAGGPENRTAEPPGHAAHRQESKSH